MKKLKLLLSGFALLGGVLGAQADDVFKDITTGKITNPSFEAADAVVSEKNSTGDLTTGWSIQAISFGRVAVFNSSSTATSPYNTYGSSAASADTYYLIIRSNENTESTDRTQTVRQKTAMSLTKNTYRISFDYKVAQCTGNTLTLTVSALNGSTSLAKKDIDIPQVAANTSYFGSQVWTNGSFDLELTETKDVKIDITCITRSKKDGSKTTFALLDNFKLEWNLTESLKDLISEANTFLTTEGDAGGTSYTALKSAIDAANAVKESTDASTLETQYNALTDALDLAKNHRKPWLTAWNTANTNYEAATYANVTGTEKTALKAEIDKSEPSTAGDYDSAKNDLVTANTNFTAAKTNYDKYAAEVENAAALGVDPIPALDVASNYSDKLKALIVLEDAAVTAGFTQDITARVVDSWSTSNADEKTDAEHWSGESHTYYNRYQESGFTMYAKKTVSLPAGTYVLKAAARCDKRNEENAYYLGVTIDGDQTKELYTSTSGGTGKGIATNGNANYTEGTFANEGAGYGWEWRFVGFTLVETKEVELKISANIFAKGWVSFSDIQLLTTSATEKNVLIKLLNEEITAAAAIDNTTNVGSNAFQIPSSAAEALDDAITAAQGIYDASALKSSSELEDAINDLKSAETAYATAELNAPDPTKKYFIKVKTADHAKLGNAIVVSLGSISTSNPTGYTFNASAAPAPYLADNYQSFKFTKVLGNNYIVSIDGPSGTVYLTNGDKNGSTAGHKVNQIQANSDSEKAMQFKFAPSPNNGAFVIYNTEANATIACESGGSIYTTSGNADFAIEEAVASVPITIASDVKLATRIFPFTPVLPSGVKAYSCEAAAGDVLTLVEVVEPAANTPYILYAENGYSGDALTGYGTATTDSYTAGWLTGVYTSRAATAGNYVLQNQSGTIAFYEVEDVIPTIGAYRCYLTASASARALYINFNEATVVETIKALTNGKNTIYNAAGTVVPSLQKGLNIIKTSDGTIRKVMVK